MLEVPESTIVAAAASAGEEFGHIRLLNSVTQCIFAMASIAQLVEHALRKRTVVGSIPTGGFFLFSLWGITFGLCGHSCGFQLLAILYSFIILWFRKLL